MKIKETKRHLIQGLAAFLSNANLVGFAKGEIWQGASKRVCVPGLNCYSCPGALGSCPIGSLQAVLSGHKQGFSYYVVGLLLFFGVLLGRLICGFLCPFGFLQDLLHKIKSRKVKIPQKVDKPLRALKYVLLVVLVIILPMTVAGAYGIGVPWFCKLVCPAGTLEGGIPLLIQNESLRAAVGFLFSWKMLILTAVVVGSVFLYRPFCKYLCPLGAIYGLFNRLGFYQMKVDEKKCVHCGACEKACGMEVKVTENINSVECIRCNRCKKVCPHGAINSGFLLGKDFPAAGQKHPGKPPAEA